MSPPDRTIPDLTVFDAILLDMNGTFMFGHDRLGDDEDYHRTYRALGGEQLDPQTVHRLVTACCQDLAVKYEDAAWQDRYPSVKATLREASGSAGLPDLEIDLVVEVIASHELGDVSPPYAQSLGTLSATHRLGVVSNLWSDKRRWLERLQNRGLLELFEVLVFSSDGPHMKPSPAIFERALDALGVAPDRTLFVGDDPRCDVMGAGALGMRTLLVGDRRAAGIAADWHLSSLIELAPAT